ncbi:hypothetical protein GCM10022243_42390 [Saccharothrix violaceirubra]
MVGPVVKALLVVAVCVGPQYGAALLLALEWGLRWAHTLVALSLMVGGVVVIGPITRSAVRAAGVEDAMDFSAGIAARSVSGVLLFVCALQSLDAAPAPVRTLETCTSVRSYIVVEEIDRPEEAKYFDLVRPSGRTLAARGKLHYEVGRTWVVEFDPNDPEPYTDPVFLWSARTSWTIMAVCAALIGVDVLWLGLCARRVARPRDTPPSAEFRLQDFRPPGPG